jgi:hypothetical protein
MTTSLTGLPHSPERHDEDYARERRRQLEYYLHALLSNRHLMSQSKVLPSFLGLLPGTAAPNVNTSTSVSSSSNSSVTASQTLLKELFKRRRDEYYEKLELEASTTRLLRQNEEELMETLWIEKPSGGAYLMTDSEGQPSGGGGGGGLSLAWHLNNWMASRFERVLSNHWKR